ncbi:MAG TPA: hypothetical protein VFN61_15225 [Acidimicrobiales bacterium]|nr:hypothetical protein [Acidimicrobiales bacterium]
MPHKKSDGTLIRPGHRSRNIKVQVNPVAQVRPGRRGRRGSGRTAAGATAAVAAVLALALGGCSSSATYLGDSGYGFYYKVPAGWYVASEPVLKRLQFVGTPAAATAAQEGLTRPVYVSLALDGTANDIEGPLLQGGRPVVLGYVFSINPSDAQNFSLASLESFYPDIQSARSQGASVKQIFPPRYVFRGQLRGTRVGYFESSPQGDMGYQEIAVMDPPSDKVWLLFGGCSISCYQSHSSQISKIIDTLRVIYHG